MKRRAGHRGFVRILAFALGIAPALGLWARAWAGGDHDDDADDAAAQVAPPPSRAEIAKRRREVLEAIRKDDTALINVSQRDMPASPDILNLGRGSAKALARCVSDNVDDSLRALCAALLGRLGDRQGLAALQGALEAWDPSVRGAALEALRQIPDPSSVEPVAKVLDREDEEPGNRVEALTTLGVLSDARAVKKLREVFQRSSDHGLKTAAFRGLWKSRHLMARTTLVGDVQSALGSDVPELIHAATFAAAELRAPSLGTALMRLFEHPDVRIRNRAVHALGKIGDRAATKALLTHVPRVRESRMLNNIAFALERLDPKAFFATAKGLVGHKQAQIRMNAAFVLGDVHRPEGLDLLRSALDDKNTAVKLGAVNALGKIDAPDAIKLLEKYIDDPNVALRRAAIYSIFTLSGAKRMDLVRDRLYASKDAALHLEAAIALGKAGDDRVGDDLVACLERSACSVDDVSAALERAKSPLLAGRTLLAWTRGRNDVTDLVAALRPAGSGPIAVSEVQASLARSDRRRALVAIDLAGDLTEAAARPVLEPMLAHESTALRLHAAVALARAGVAAADAVIVRALDELPHDELPAFARLVGRIAEPAARARLTPKLLEREKGADVDVAVAAAAVRLAWDPESGFFRMLAALAAPGRFERDLAERYLVAAKSPVVTAVLRRALAREGRDAVRDHLRRILALRTDRDGA